MLYEYFAGKFILVDLTYKISLFSSSSARLSRALLTCSRIGSWKVSSISNSGIVSTFPDLSVSADIFSDSSASSELSAFLDLLGSANIFSDLSVLTESSVEFADLLASDNIFSDLSILAESSSTSGEISSAS